jgi:hypothetical protein
MFDLRCAMFDVVSKFGRLSVWDLTSHIGPRTSNMLAYRPFLEPAPIDRYWMWFLPPLILVIALVYRTIKSESLADLPRQAGYLAFQISVFMVLAAAALWLLLLFV